MKKIILLMCAYLYVVTVCAQAHEIRNAEGRVIAFECSAGDIRLANQQPELVVVDTLGSLDTLVSEDIEAVNEGSAVLVHMVDSVNMADAAGDVFAIYDYATNEIRNTDGVVLLKMNESQEIFDVDDQLLGWIDASGNVYGSDSVLLAEAFGIEPYKLACLFFIIK